VADRQRGGDAGLPLTQVMVNDTAVSDAGLLTLMASPTLTSINAYDSQVTEEGIAAALAVSGHHPDLRIYN
jgi:hypothetical protein